ncbi:MAG: hypothetical protein DRJ09_08860 [Bacteroidetes bacterium]|nr:MAG: hypothetical protein DRJ09_08860 [Bacteroidota bacterium]
MKLFFKIVVITALWAVASRGMAQNSLLVKTLDSAKVLRNERNFKQAIGLLEAFDARYSDNYWLLQLYAETLFWMKEYDKADKVYRRAIRVYPDNYEIKYEYALFLYDRGHYQSARELLLLYNQKYPNIGEVQSLLGITSYYLGDFKEAGFYLESSLKKNPNNKTTKQIYTEVSHIVKPWLKGDFLFTKDSQPMSQWMPALSGGWYQSHFLNLSFNATYQNFLANSINSGLSGFIIKNSLIIPKAGFKATIGAGGFYSFIDSTLNFVWSLKLDQRLTKNLHLKADAERSPYTYTIASIANPFLSNKYNASLSYETKEGWNANLGYLSEYFPDTNHVQTAFAWVLSPTFKFSVFSVNVGYAFNYSNAKENRYVSEQSLDDILTDYDSTKQITGVYNPYFTPNQQFSNSLLANVFIVPSSNINVKLHASVGIFSRTMNPYLYLDKKQGRTVIKRDFYQDSFLPLDLGINFNYNMSNKMKLFVSYQYLQTFYYNTNNFNVGLKLYF